MFSVVKSAEELNSCIEAEEALLVYFSTAGCSVCKILKPKIELMLVEKYPQVKLLYVDIDDVPEAAGLHRIFTVPVVLVFFMGKETIRRIRVFSTEELNKEISRPYAMVFSE